MSKKNQFLLLNQADDVVVALEQLIGGAPLVNGATVSGLIPAGHKAAIRPIAQGQAVRRYGQIIGFASKPIAAGQHVHTHNMAIGEFDKDYRFSQDYIAQDRASPQATFQGIVRANGQVAGGANLICFTTGRGSAYGCAPSPSLKLATNTALWNRQQDDMDMNCGSVIDDGVGIEQLGRELFRMILDCASGVRSRSEIHGYGQNEFVPWQLSVIT